VADSPENCVGIDAAIEMFPKTVAERLDRALLNLERVNASLGQGITIPSQEVYPLLLANNTKEAWFILQQFEQDGYIKGRTDCFPTEVSLTAKELTRIAELQRGVFGPFDSEVFIAMSFDKSLDAAWTDGLKPGIEDCGYDAIRVDAKEHNEKIYDFIIAEIRKSKFLVADFTLHRNGVYFEAGLMMGLGRPVIFTCHKDDLKNAHFDTRQYNHIEWETPAELRERLKRRIQATIAP
jgi:nucleoside 2-deoxyribosyltransferase